MQAEKHLAAECRHSETHGVSREIHGGWESHLENESPHDKDRKLPSPRLQSPWRKRQALPLGLKSVFRQKALPPLAASGYLRSGLDGYIKSAQAEKHCVLPYRAARAAVFVAAQRWIELSPPARQALTH